MAKASGNSYFGNVLWLLKRLRKTTRNEHVFENTRNRRPCARCVGAGTSLYHVLRSSLNIRYLALNSNAFLNSTLNTTVEIHNWIFCFNYQQHLDFFYRNCNFKIPNVSWLTLAPTIISAHESKFDTLFGLKISAFWYHNKLYDHFSEMS